MFPGLYCNVRTFLSYTVWNFGGGCKKEMEGGENIEICGISHEVIILTRSRSSGSDLRGERSPSKVRREQKVTIRGQV